MPSVVISIPLHNAEPYLDGLFGSLGRYYPPFHPPLGQGGERGEVMVRVVAVNDQSPDGTAKIVRERYPWVDLIETPRNVGFAKANNFAAEYALEKYRPEYLFILNQDTEISEGCLERLVEAMERDATVAIAHPLVMRYPKSEGIVNSAGNNISFLGYGYITHDGATLAELPADQRQIHEVGYMAGMGFLIRTSVVRQLNQSVISDLIRNPNKNKKIKRSFGFLFSFWIPLTQVSRGMTEKKVDMIETRKHMILFDPDYINYHEDTDLALRVKMLGYKMVCVPSATLEHKYISPTKKKYAQSRNVYYWIERNRFLLFAKFYTLRTLVAFLPALIVNEIGVMGYSFVQGFWKERLRVYGWLAMHIPFLLKKREEVLRTKEWERKFFDILVPDVQYTEMDNPFLRIANWIWRGYFTIVKQILQN